VRWSRVRETLIRCFLLTARYGVKVVGGAADGLDTMGKAQPLKPDAFLVDLAMPHMTGLKAILKIRKKNPGACFLVLPSFGEQAKVSAAIKAGAMGSLLQDLRR
jgi:DNA-binding NarL/FixJ family response regulator